MVAVSPPPEFGDLPAIEDSLADLDVPTLVGAASQDAQVEPARLRSAVEDLGDDQVRVRILPGTGHGYSLLTDGALTADPVVSPLGREVRRISADA